MSGHGFDNDFPSRRKQSPRQLGIRRAAGSNRALVCQRALGSHHLPRVTTDYNQIGLKTDLREINSPQATHRVAVVEEQCGDSSPTLKTSHVRIPEPFMPDFRGGTDFDRALNLKSCIIPDPLDHVQQSKLPNSETPRPLSLKMGRDPDFIPPTRPDICDLSLIRQEPAETVHHYWARFLLVMDRIKDCREEDAISLFLQ